MEESGRSKARQQSPSGKKTTLESYIGKHIKVKTASNEEVEGLIYTYDKTTNCLVIDILFYMNLFDCTNTTLTLYTLLNL